MKLWDSKEEKEDLTFGKKNWEIKAEAKNCSDTILGKTEKRNSELGEISILIHSIEMVTEITHIYTPGKAKQGKRIN